MSTPFKLRFQPWLLLSTTLLVVLLAIGFLITVVRTFDDIAEQTASTHMVLIADRATDQLDKLLHHHGRFVVAQARAEKSHFVRADGRIEPRLMVSGLLASLEADPTLYSHFFGLSNEEFLQVIGIRGDARIAHALQAPTGAWFAVRHIQRKEAGERLDHYLFLDRDRQPIGTHVLPATLVPSQRPWYGAALRHDGLIITDPYFFASTGELGITVATPLPDRAGVLASDISLRSLQDFLATLYLPSNGTLAVLDGQQRVLAFRAQGDRLGRTAIKPLTPAGQIEPPALGTLLASAGKEAPGASVIVSLAGERHVVARLQTQPIGNHRFDIVVLAPLAEFTDPFRQAERNVLQLVIIVLLVLLPLAFLGSRRVAHALEALAEDSEYLKRLDFSHPPHHPDTFLYEVDALGAAQRVMHDAIHQRTTELQRAQEKLASLVDNGLRLSRDHDRATLLRHILFGAREIAHCAAATLFLKTGQNTLAFTLRTAEDPLPTFEIPLYTADGQPNDSYVVVHAALSGQSVLIDDVYAETRFDLSGTKRFSEESGFRTISMLTVPLSPRAGEVIGVLQLLNALDPQTGAAIPFPPELVGYIEALASQSAVAIENHNLLEAQREMLEAIIKLIAGAIDAKSPYTGGHCERVPELATMLAEEAGKVQEGPLADFRFETDDEWREFRIGAWLHDCGKVTTPEYVVDKATKLETIHNRIHEIRTRFEVLLRDARIAELQAVIAGEDRASAHERFEKRCAELQDDFAFVATCNLGGEFMTTEKIDRLRHIAAQTWQRHFDDRLGLSHEELARYPANAAPLPATEMLLADKPQHIIPRTRHELADPKWGFKVDVPEHQFNLGELYNLSVARGTLTEEERFKINEHVIQGLMMLEQLPLPKNMRRIPQYAGTHHETLTGSGYPRRLTAAQLDIPMRIMAIADIFEALTASDRPYKKAKPLSEAIHILSSFVSKGHIDADLFELFLSSGVYRRYAERYLRPEQIDEVDLSRYLTGNRE